MDTIKERIATDFKKYNGTSLAYYTNNIDSTAAILTHIAQPIYHAGEHLISTRKRFFNKKFVATVATQIRQILVIIKSITHAAHFTTPSIDLMCVIHFSDG